MTRQYNNRGQQINIETVQGDVVVQKSTRSNAEWTLLQEVDREVESRLTQSLHNAAFINLGKQSQPEQCISCCRSGLRNWGVEWMGRWAST